MSNRFEDVSRAFEQDERRPQLAQERAEVSQLLQAAQVQSAPGLDDLSRWRLNRAGIVPNRRPFVEPTGYRSEPEQV